MSESYGECELGLGTAGNQFFNALWAQAAAQGISVFVSSGDNGSAGCDNPGGPGAIRLAVNGIASTPYNAAIGGTDFNEYTSPATYWNISNTSDYTGIGEELHPRGDHGMTHARTRFSGHWDGARTLRQTVMTRGWAGSSFRWVGRAASATVRLRAATLRRVALVATSSHHGSRARAYRTTGNAIYQMCRCSPAMVFGRTSIYRARLMWRADDVIPIIPMRISWQWAARRFPLRHSRGSWRW